MLKWEPYPGATEYSVQLYKKSDPYEWSNETIFPWSHRPKVSDPSFDLAAQNVRLKPGHSMSWSCMQATLRTDSFRKRHRYARVTTSKSSNSHGPSQPV